MSFQDEAVAFHTKFLDIWNASEYDNVPFYTENNRGQDEEEGSFVEFQIIPSTADLAELGGGEEGRFHRYWGIVQATIYVPFGEGTAKARGMADVIANGFRNAELSYENSGKIVCYTPRIRPLGPQEAKYRIAVSVEYKRDIRQ